MKKPLTALIIIMLVSVVFGGCSENSDVKSSTTQSDTESSAVEETTEEENYESDVIDILDSTSFMDSIDPSYVQYGLCSDITFGELLASMFEDPQLDITPTKSQDTGALLKESDDIYLKFGADTKVYGVDKEKEIREIRRKAIQTEEICIVYTLSRYGCRRRRWIGNLSYL